MALSSWGEPIAEAAVITPAEGTGPRDVHPEDPQKTPQPTRDPGPRELDHRIANSLQLAADFLLLQQAKLTDPFARASLIDAAERLVAVGHLHGFLARHDAGAGHVDLRAFLVELAALISQGTGLRCTVEAEALDLPATMAQQVGLAVNELAINAAKHAYARREAGDLRIEAELEGQGLRITVADHGAGLGAGFDPEGGRGLGMSIVAAIVRQLKARFVAEDDHGARFTLLVPFDRTACETRSFAARDE